MKSVFSFFVFFIFSTCLCEEDVDDDTLTVYHSLQPKNAPPLYEVRGRITLHLSKGEGSYTDLHAVADSDIKKLRKLATTDDIYRIKIFAKGENEQSAVFSFTKACAIYESSLSDILTIALDQSNLPVGISISSYPSYCTRVHVSDSRLRNFNTTVNLISQVNGPSPDTQTYIQRLEQEKAEKARGEQGDNRSFFSKYWMYIVPVVIFLFISGASGPEGQGSGN